MNGLEAILTQLGLDEITKPRDEFTQYLVEACGLLDMPGFTLGRRNPCKRLWARYVAPFERTGIEPTTGLPRSLLDIQAWLDSPHAKHKLLLWKSEKAEYAIQYSYWEAFRLGLILLHLSLHAVNGDYVPGNGGETENLIIGILAFIAALRKDDGNLFKIPLRRCVLFPLFIAALNTEEGSELRSTSSQEFEAFVVERGFSVDHIAWSTLLEVWSQRRNDQKLAPYAVADRFVNSMGLELHLY